MELSSAAGASTRFLGLTQRCDMSESGVQILAGTGNGEPKSSFSEDLGCRGEEFSRKYYGSVELLLHLVMLMEPFKELDGSGWRMAPLVRTFSSVNTILL
ncbi:uncharacterized protein LOC120749887 isoform X2 [Hirundo rustica]|uniref:uncharacterized protein LOC120749887 isoform X2 n=1 Tax=Hirundo rustica TaxID=43150 RepID=UPI001A952B14|nr:uncharacterized protein LOC120749887 isoform X2 [Hirundo rustica]